MARAREKKTMTTDKPPSALATAERAARRMTLTIGSGLVAYVLGSIGTSGVVRRVAPALAEMESDLSVMLISGVLQSLWVLVVLPASGWLVGRYLEVPPWRYAVPAAFTGLFFDLMISVAVFGSDSLYVDWVDALFRGVLFFIGIALTMLAVRAGATRFVETQVRAKAAADSQRAAYEDFAKRNQP